MPDQAAIVCDRLAEMGVDGFTLDERLVEQFEPADACAMGGWVLRIAGAGEMEIAGVVALGAPLHLAWLDPGMLDWESGEPALVAGLLAPGLANLYFLGAGTTAFRAGGIALLTAMIQAQTDLEHPLVDELMRIVPASHRTVAGRAARRVERRIERRLRPSGSGSWRRDAGDIDGPLAAARGA
jgi:hypothetical protein